MITVSNDINNMLQADARNLDMRILKASDRSVVDCSIKNISIHKGACGEFQVGTVYVPYADIIMDYDVTLPSKIIIQCGAKVGNSYSYFDIGQFIPITPKKSPYTTAVNCQGILSGTNELLYASEPTSRTLNDLLTAIRNKGYSVTLNNITLPSASVGGALLGLSVRDVLQIIASCVGGFVTEDNSGGIVISRFNPCTTSSLNLSGERSMEIPEFKGEFVVSGCKVIVDEATVYEETPNNVVIENPYFTSDMWNTFKGNLTGLTFESGTFNVSLGDPRLEAWDCVKITDDDSVDHFIPCLTLTFNYDGALTMDIEADVQLDEEKESFTGGAITQKLTELNNDVKKAFEIATETQTAVLNQLTETTQTAYSLDVESGATLVTVNKYGGKSLVFNQLNNNNTSTSTYAGITFTNYRDGSWTLYGTRTGTNTSANVRYVPGTYFLVEGHKYYISAISLLGDNLACIMYRGNTRVGSNDKCEQIVTAPAQNGTYDLVRIRVSDTYESAISNVKVYPMCIDLTQMFGEGNEPSTVEEFRAMFPAEYYAYNEGEVIHADVDKVVYTDTDEVPTDYLIPQAIRNLEGYGWSAGSVYNEVNFERKKFIKRVGRVDLGSLTWTYTASAMRFRGQYLSPIAKNTTSEVNGTCDSYMVSNKPWFDSDRTDLQIFPKADVVYVHNFAYTDATAFKSAMQGKYLYYELETPIEVDISETLESFEVEDGGTITFHNSNGDDYRIPVESKLMWYDSSLESRAKADSENASKTATNYLKYIPQDGLYVTDDVDTLDNAVKIDSNSVDVLKQDNLVASFGANGIVLGTDTNAQTIITQDGIKISNSGGIVGVSVDSSGVTETATKEVNVYATIRYGNSYTLTLDNSIARGTSLRFHAELYGYSEYGDEFTITVGTGKSGRLEGNVLLSYTYNATNNQITITADEPDGIVLCSYRYNVTTKLPRVQLNGVLEINGNPLYAGWITVEQKTKSVGDIASGSAFNGNFSVAKGGYTPIAISGYQCSGSGTTYINMTQLYLNNGAVYYYGRNTRSGVATLTLYVWVLYLKNA